MTLLHEALLEEHEELRRTVRRVIARGEHDAGWAAIALPESVGGAGLGYGALAAVVEELGAALSPLPVLATAMAATVVRDETTLRRLAAGETASLVTGDLAFAGTAWHVIWDGERALVQRASGERVDTLDPTRPLVRVAGAAGRLSDGARVLLAAEQLGGAARCLAVSVEHARTRVQFGRPIGSFQAVKHLLADMLVRVEAARSAVRYAAWAQGEAPAEAATAASVAAVTAGQAYLACAGDTVQVHGGIGFTWEHEAGRHLKRARSTVALAGGLGERRDAVAAQLGL